jgi:hypothetical protein
MNRHERRREASKARRPGKIISFNIRSPEEAEFIKAVERENAKGTMEIASDDDRAWFAANPTRSYRLRGPLAGEHFHWRGDVTRASAIVVHLAAPGQRLRIAATLKRAVETYPDDEATAQMLWEEGAERYPQVQQVVQVLHELGETRKAAE